MKITKIGYNDKNFAYDPYLYKHFEANALDLYKILK